MSSRIDHKYSKNILLLLLTLVIFCVCSGCKEKLYSGLSEKEVNEMLAVLLRNGIASDKMPGEEGTWDLSVDAKDIAIATEILKYNGYPQNHYRNIGDIFKKEGLISSPLEERVRYIYGLSQEVSQTISQIDGIISARVHIVLPENNPLSDNLTPSSASVFIKHRENAGIESQILKIKELVVNSIEGLDYKNVTVALFPAQADYFAMEPAFVNVLGIKLSSDSLPKVKVFSILLLLFVAMSLGGNIYFYMNSDMKFVENNVSALSQKLRKKLLQSGKRKKEK